MISGKSYKKAAGFTLKSASLSRSHIKAAGFTLIEFLIVIGILSLSVGSIILLLTSVIRGTNQTNVTAEVKQNGQSVLDSIEGEIRSAVTVNQMVSGELYGANSGIEVVKATGENLYIICKNEYVDPGNSSNNENGWIGIARGTSAPLGLNFYEHLTSADTRSGVNIICAVTGSQAFQRHLDANDNTTGVTVYFSAQQAINAPTRADFIAESQFKTTIGLRDYQ